MAGVKGRSGTNKGKDKPWSDALRLVVFRDDAEGNRRLLKIAERCASAAESGDMVAVREIGDRLDGKPAQSVEMSGGLDLSHEDALNELDEPGTDNPDKAKG